MLMPAASSPTDTPPAPPAACQSSLGSFALNHHSEPWDRNSALEMKGNSRRDLKWRKVTQSESRSIAPSNMAAHIQKILRDHSASSHLFLFTLLPGHTFLNATYCSCVCKNGKNIVQVIWIFGPVMGLWLLIKCLVYSRREVTASLCDFSGKKKDVNLDYAHW
jgi:hypothetical protein